MLREVIEWHDVGEQLPDDGLTVMVCMPASDEPVWLGWHESDTWFSIDGAELEGVERWAEMPTGEATA